jgi:predicted nucleotidyltransferase
LIASDIFIDQGALTELCRRQGVAKLSMFGSALRGDFDPDRSDVDLLVEFAPGVSKSLFKLVRMQDELGDLFGREVDLTTPGSLSKYIRDDILSAAVVLYDAA